MTQSARLEKSLYTAVAISTGGRDGRARSDDGAIDLALSTPKGLGGNGGSGTNPEQLFAAGYSACFGNAVLHIARQQKLRPDVTVTAHVSIGPVGQAFGLAVKLEVTIEGVPREKAQELLEAAHRICPYSNATRGNIEVDPQLTE